MRRILTFAALLLASSCTFAQIPLQQCQQAQNGVNSVTCTLNVSPHHLVLVFLWNFPNVTLDYSDTQAHAVSIVPGDCHHGVYGACGDPAIAQVFTYASLNKAATLFFSTGTFSGPDVFRLTRHDGSTANITIAVAEYSDDLIGLVSTHDGCVNNPTGCSISAVPGNLLVAQAGDGSSCHFTTPGLGFTMEYNNGCQAWQDQTVISAGSYFVNISESPTTAAGLVAMNFGLGAFVPPPPVTEYVRGVWVFDQGTTPPPPSTPLSVTSVSPLPSAAVNSSYSVTLQATGGTSPYAWTLAIGTLPAGLNLDASSGTISGSPTTSGTSAFTVQVMDSVNTRATKDLSLTVLVGTPPPPPGQEDLLQWVVMDNRRYTEHLDGTWTFLSPADDHGVPGATFWWIKAATGNPWDIDQYDASNLSFWITENGEQAPDNPSAYKRFVTPVKLAPRFFTPGDTVTIDTAAPNNIKRTINCEVDAQALIDLGHIRGVTSGPTSIAWGGTLGTQSTIELDYFWGGSGATYDTRERFSFVKGYGRVKWDTAHWDGVSSYVVDSAFTHNTLVAGGTPTPNFACGFAESWWPGSVISHTVLLSWIASGGATSYNVKRTTTNGSCKTISPGVTQGSCSTIASDVTQTQYSDASVKSGITYFYVVSAVNSVGESANSGQAIVTIP